MNIDLASFNINTDQLFQKLVQTRAEIDKVKASQSELKKEFATSNKDVATNQKSLDELNKKLSELTKGTDSYNQTLVQRDNAEKALNESSKQQLAVNQSYQATLTASQLELNKLNSQSRSYQSVLDAQNRSTNDSITLYERQRAELSLLQKEQRELGVQLERAKSSGNKEAVDQLTVAYKQATDKANDLAVELRNIDTAGGNFTSNIGNYKSALEDFKGALFSGDTQGLKESFNAITGSIKGMITQSLAFIATPIGAAITALVGIGAAAKAVFDFNQGIQESNQLLKGLGVSSGEISKVRTELEATSETYGKSFEEIAKTADSLATSYGISISEANDIIAKGLVQGGTGNEDFLNQISEYDVQFQKLGFTAEESLNLVNKGFSEGVYNDKLPDAIKEVGLALEEGTKASQDALTNAFGKSFSDNLFKSVQNGTLSTKDALIQIGQEADKVGLNLQQQGQLTADVFKGAGEDAGGALKIIEILNSTQKKGLTETEQAFEDLRAANERYNAVQSELFEIENFGSVWANIKAQALNFFVDIIDYVAELKNDFQPLIDLVGIVLVNAFESGKAIIGSVFTFIGGALKSVGIVFKGFVDFVKKVFSGDFKGAINVIGETFSKLLASVQNTFNKIRNTIIDGLKSIVSNLKPILSTLGVDVDKLQKKLDGLKGKVIENKSVSKNVEEKETEITSKKTNINQKNVNKDNKDNKDLKDAQKAKEDAQKKADEALKKELDSAQKLADEKVKLANVELNAYIEKNKSILDSEKFLTSELLKQEQERLRNIEKAKLDQEKLEFDTADKILKDKITAIEKDKTLNQTQKNELETLKLQQKELELQYNSDVTKIREETQKGITATETRYSKERIEAEKMRKAIQYQTELLDLEAKGASEAEIKTVQLDQQTQLELDKFIEKQDTLFQAKIEKDQEQRDIQAEIDLIQAELETELANTKDENEKIRIQTQLDEINNLEKTNAQKKIEINKQAEISKRTDAANTFGQIASLLGQETTIGKAAALAQATLSGINGVQAAYTTAQKSPITVGFPAYPLVQAGLAGAFSAVQIAKISGFASGGLIDGGFEISRSNGDNRLITAKDGEVILNESQQRAIGGASIFKSIGVPGFATGGVVGSPISSLTNIQNQFTNQLNSEVLTESIRNAVLEGSAIGTATGSQRGISDLQNNSYIASTANF
jgi:hypothetical protein